MVDSDSDDELMSRLASSVMARALPAEDCTHCGQPHAATVCTICHSAHYCNETCLRRNAKAHRAFCITARMRKEESDDSDESDSDEDESDSDGDGVGGRAAPSRSSSISSRRSSGPSNSSSLGGFQVPGLTSAQIARLLELSTRADKAVDERTIDQLQAQIAQLVAAQATAASSRDRTPSSSAPVKLKDIKELQQKLLELEKKTQSMAAPGAAPSVYRPLLVKDDPALRRYFKLKDMAMPAEQIKAKMESDGVDPALLDTPDDVSPNDPGPAPGAYVPLTVGSDPVFKKYFKLKSMNMPVAQIKLKMEADGVDSDLLDHPTAVSPNDPGPPARSEPLQFQDPLAMRMSLPVFPASVSAPPYVPLLIRDDPAFAKYFKLLQMGMPVEQAKLKMAAESFDPTVLDRPDDVSPNDPGPPSSSAVSGGTTGPVSMEQLFSILMQHQQIIQSGAMGGPRSASGSGGADALAAPRSVEDQMARELADAESAIDDIFGDEQQASGASKAPGSGMSMIEQLEKKARKESNKKLVEHRDEVNRAVALLLEKTLVTDEGAIAFFAEISPALERLGLSLGADAVQTWSARLLIKNKDTRDWYFSEQERLDAGKAYSRLWSLSFLDRDTGQLLAKRAQLLNAPSTLRASAKSKPELIDKFTQLLKDTVKLKHKVFKNSLYAAELQRLRANNIPEQFEARGTQLIDASAALAAAAMDLADEEFRLLAATTRAKKIRALAALHVAEKAVQLVGIVKKLGAHGVDDARLEQVERTVAELKETYVAGQQQDEDEDEDDVL